MVASQLTTPAISTIEAMVGTMDRARRIASELLVAKGRVNDARIVASGGGDDFAEVQIARSITEAAFANVARLERALRCYADPTFWEAECPETSLAFHDAGEIARSALVGKELYAQHRD
jgi:hypothetical protein